jgi:hypothetical protein
MEATSSSAARIGASAWPSTGYALPLRARRRSGPGRKVAGFMSGNQQDPDMICEVFVLAPNDVAH